MVKQVVVTILLVLLSGSATAQDTRDPPIPTGPNVEHFGIRRCDPTVVRTVFRSIDGEGASINFKVVNLGRGGDRPTNCEFDVVVVKLVDHDLNPATPRQPQQLAPIRVRPGEDTGVVGGTGILRIDITNCTSVRGEQGCYGAFIW